MAASSKKMTDGHNLEIPETTPLIGVKYERIDYVPDGQTPQGNLSLGKICLVSRNGNAAENITLPVLYNKETGNRFASYGQTANGEYRRNIQGITAETVEEYRAMQAMVQGWVRAAVQLFFRPIEVKGSTTSEQPKSNEAAEATA